MATRQRMLGTLASLGFLVCTAPGAVSFAIDQKMISEIRSEMSATTATAQEFRRIDQPLSHRLGVTIGGLGLMGLELWWFLMSRLKSPKVK